MDELLKMIEALIERKQTLVHEEEEFVAALNQALPQIGYRIVPAPLVQNGLPGAAVAREAPDPNPDPTPWVCDQCGRRFRQKANLVRHQHARGRHSARSESARAA